MADRICLRFLQQSVKEWNAVLGCPRQLGFRGCRACASSLDFSSFAGRLHCYQMKAFLFLECCEGDIAEDMISAEPKAVGKAGGVEWAHRLLIANKFHLWSLGSPWEWEVPLELCVGFFRSTELSHWNFLSSICVFVKLNAMAKQESASFLRSRLRHTGTQPWFCVFRMGANRPPYLSPGFLIFKCHGPQMTSP